MKQYSIKNPPELPASCPPLPAGQVHLGQGQTFKPHLDGSSFTGYAIDASDPDALWMHNEWAGDSFDYYAAPEGSEIVKLNFGEPLGSWADELPREYVDLVVKRFDRDHAGKPLSDPGLDFIDLFRWDGTPERHAFWTLVDDYTLGRVSKLPPIPTGGAAATPEKPLTTAEQVARIEKKLAEQDALLASISKLIADFNATNA